MICLTGDVHHSSLLINDQRHIDDPSLTEIRIAQHYVQLLEKHGVNATLYVCGRCFTEEWDDLEPVVASPRVEVGGHMFNARFPRECFDAYGEQTGLWNGPRWYQDLDIGRNVEVVREKTGEQLVSWRGHSYKVDCNTYELLAKHGLKVTSDAIEKDTLWPERIEAGIISHPLNVIPDHDHLYHAHRTREYVEKINAQGYGEDAFGAVSYTIEEWGELVLRQALGIDERGGIATILCHPLCMWLADRFQTFERLLAVFAKRRTIHARDMVGLVDSPPDGLTCSRRPLLLTF
ncbi:MAG: polysaccharide deacetylase family protein [Lentisphaeria bacterium]|nr:polysaccharide deacetylase family protein [Lentisphaeria bacterium]